MAGRRRALPGDRQAGGSLSLAGLIDRAGEEIYLDLKEYWQFDLADFLAGDTNSNPALVLALIRGLPEDARWTSRLKRELEEEGSLEERIAELDPEEAEAAEERFWTPDRVLMATLINAVYQNTQATGHWKDNKPPEMPVIGPSKWDPKNKPSLVIDKGPAEPDPNADPLDFLTQHMTRLGMPAGGGRNRF